MNATAIGIEFSTFIRFGRKQRPGQTPAWIEAAQSAIAALEARRPGRVYMLTEQGNDVKKGRALWLPASGFVERVKLDENRIIDCRSRFFKINACLRYELTHLVSSDLALLRIVPPELCRVYLYPDEDNAGAFADPLLAGCVRAQSWDEVLNIVGN